jgi:hypothetical protein
MPFSLSISPFRYYMFFYTKNPDKANAMSGTEYQNIRGATLFHGKPVRSAGYKHTPGN